MQIDPIIARDVDASAKIQCFMKNGEGLILGHVDFVQHTKTAEPCALADRTFPECNFSILPCVGTDQGRGISVDAERNIKKGASESSGQIFSQHIFAGSLRTGQQEVFSA